jgi:hypothetical protein
MDGSVGGDEAGQLHSSLLKVCAHLESILSDESLPRVRWMREAFMLEPRYDARLAATALVVYIIETDFHPAL